MSIDRELYRKANELHSKWNLSERIDRAYNAGKRTPLECWREYIAWWEFLVNNFPMPSELQQVKRLKDWTDYYTRIQSFEAWCKENEESA
jgi:hypothetical protein